MYHIIQVTKYVYTGSCMLVSEFSFTSPTQGLTKKNLKPLPLATEDSIRENKAALVKDLERKLHFREDANQQSGQQVRKLSVIKINFTHEQDIYYDVEKKVFVWVSCYTTLQGELLCEYWFGIADWSFEQKA